MPAGWQRAGVSFVSDARKQGSQAHGPTRFYGASGVVC